MNLLRNELIKIFKRKNIFIVLFIGIIIITCYTLFQKFTSSNMDIIQQYQRAYNNDKILLENYNQISSTDSYEDIIERIELEKYAIENNITYNILFVKHMF